MKANFPTKPSGIIGKPNLQELVRILQYLMMCAQTHKSSISPAINLLYLAVPPEIYAQYTQEAYPNANYPTPADVPIVPDYAMAQDDNDRARITAEHAAAVKRREDVINMHNALADTFLDMFEPTYRAAYDRRNVFGSPMQFFEMYFTISSRRMAAALPKIVMPTGNVWQPTGNQVKVLKPSSIASTAVFNTPSSPSQPSPTKMLLTLLSVSSLVAAFILKK